MKISNSYIESKEKKLKKKKIRVMPVIFDFGEYFIGNFINFLPFITKYYNIL